MKPKWYIIFLQWVTELHSSKLFCKDSKSFQTAHQGPHRDWAFSAHLKVVKLMMRGRC